MDIVPRCHSRHAWLAAAIPAFARRFRVADPELAATLAAANAQIAEADPEVEIVSSPQIVGTAPYVIVNVDRGPASSSRQDREPFPLKTTRRLRASVAARVEARRASLALERRGFRTTSFVWDLEQVLRPLGESRRERLRPVERFPRSVVVIGARGQEPPTTLEAVAREAAAAVGGLTWSLPLVQESGLVVRADRAVLRVSVGPGAGAIDAQVRALDQLHAQSLPPVLADRLPGLLARGSTGLARWTLEQRLPGQRPSYPLSAELLRQGVDFLVALHRVGESEGRDLAPEIAAVAEACPADEAAAVQRLGWRLGRRLRDIRHGFAHGDFWGGNFLVDGNALTAVIDWESASAGRPPLVDLLHLEVNAERPPAPDRWGTAIVDRLIPSARAGGSDLARDYCRRIGLAVTPELLVDLVFAYWLERLALELTCFADRRLRKSWMKDNVELVLRSALAVVPATDGQKLPRL